jgi:hypothetical protein
MEENPYKSPGEIEPPAAPKRPGDGVPRKSLRIITLGTFAGGTIAFFAFPAGSDLPVVAGAVLGGLSGFVYAWLFCDEWRRA